MQVDVEVEGKEGNEKQEEAKDGVNEGGKVVSMVGQKESGGGGGGAVGMMETKEANDGVVATTTAVSSSSSSSSTSSVAAATAPAEAATLAINNATSQPSQGGPIPALALDSQTVTNQSFFTAVIVPCCQTGNVVCSASQHRYLNQSTATVIILSYLTLIVTLSEVFTLL